MNTQYRYAQSQGTQVQSRKYDPQAPQRLSNGIKVFLTVLFTVIPGVGQLAGIITAIVFMADDDDADKRSFGAAVMTASVVIFIITCLIAFTLLLVYSALK
jgi:hypothetical protein